MTDGETAGMRLALYARVSTDEQREGQTIDSQLAELERFAREKGSQIVDTYKDDGWSGGVMARPELDRLRDDARKRLFEAVLINDVDRLARDVAHLGVIKRDLERQGVNVIFRKLPSEASPTHNLMVNILGSFAEFERELIADRTRRGRRHKVEVRKQYLGSNTAYGYRYTPKDKAAGREGLLEIVPREAVIVRQMFGWVDAEGLSARRVVSRLNETRAPTRKGSSWWAKSSVLRILRNEMYVGVWYYNKFQGCEPANTSSQRRYRKHLKTSVRPRPRSEWLPLELPDALRLVPRDRWERVQRRLDQNIAFSPRNEKHFYLLKGLVRCAGCRSRYVGDPCHGKFYYRCIARCKRCPTVREHVIDQAVIEAIENVITNPEIILDQLRRLNEADVRDRRSEDRQRQDIEVELKRVATEEARVLEAYRTGIISPQQLGAELERLKARQNAGEIQKAELNDRMAPDGAVVEKSVREYCAEAARNFAAFAPEERREFLRAIVRNILFDGVSLRIQGEIPVSSEPSTANPPELLSDGRIATTTIGHSGRNPAGGKPVTGFNLAVKIVKPPPPMCPRNSLGRFSSTK